jgi:hypothetical protein
MSLRVRQAPLVALEAMYLDGNRDLMLGVADIKNVQLVEKREMKCGSQMSPASSLSPYIEGFVAALPNNRVS